MDAFRDALVNWADSVVCYQKWQWVAVPGHNENCVRSALAAIMAYGRPGARFSRTALIFSGPLRGVGDVV